MKLRMNIHSPMRTQNRRNEIMEAALELFVENGFHGAPISMIAKKANVATGSLYLYFESKEQLISELYKDIEEKIAKAIEEDYPSSKSLKERFIYAWSKLLKYAISNPLHFRYMEQYHNSPYGVALRKDWILNRKEKSKIFMQIVEEGRRNHMLRNLPVPMIFAIAFGPLICLARDHILGFIKLNDDLILKAASACWEGIKA